MKTRSKILPGLAVLLVLLIALPPLVFNAEKLTLDDEARSRLPGRFVKLGAGTVHYELAGPEDAETVVLIHGFSVPYYLWDPTFDALVREGMRALRYDLFGRGYSDRPEADYTLDFFVSQLSELLDALGVDGPVNLVGLSMGGPIAAAYANRHPGRVRSLCLIGPQGEPANGRSIFPLNVPLLGEYIMSAYMAPFLLPKSQAGDFYRPERFPGWEARYREQMKYRGFRRAILSTLRHTAVIDAIPGYAAVGKGGLPVLLLWGKEDTTMKAVNIAKVREALPAVSFHPIDEAGHMPHYERPETVNPILIAFLKNP